MRFSTIFERWEGGEIGQEAAAGRFHAGGDQNLREALSTISVAHATISRFLACMA